jgi:hypothetical protein
MALGSELGGVHLCILRLAFFDLLSGALSHAPHHTRNSACSLALSRGQIHLMHSLSGVLSGNLSRAGIMFSLSLGAQCSMWAFIDADGLIDRFPLCSTGLPTIPTSSPEGYSEMPRAAGSDHTRNSACSVAVSRGQIHLMHSLSGVLSGNLSRAGVMFSLSLGPQCSMWVFIDADGLIDRFPLCSTGLPTIPTRRPEGYSEMPRAAGLFLLCIYVDIHMSITVIYEMTYP